MSRALKGLCALLVAAAALLVAPMSHAAGTLRFCPRWGYTYYDQGLGEDYLLHESGLTYAVKPAAYTWTSVYRNGTLVWQWYLNSAGCTDDLPGSSGTYDVVVTPELLLPTGGWIGVTPYDDWVWRTFQATYNLSTIPTGNRYTYNPNLGIGDAVANVAAAVTQLALLSDNGTASGAYYSIYAEQQCPGGSISCYSNGGVYLGWNSQFGNWDSFFKSVILHETGHSIQDVSFGMQKLDYTSGNSNAALCNCDHVHDPLDRQHCIQSREMGSSAQKEGFGHFIAAITQNRASDNDATFPYYKEVKWTDYVVYSPPFAIPSYGWGLWMEQFCPGTNEGTEFDWLNFYYWVNRRTADAYSLADFRNVYRQACGGSNCTTAQDTTWTSLKNAVNTLYGTNSTKASFWRNQGDLFGVDH